jgi:mono/diheme cytochrome c family protein
VKFVLGLIVGILILPIFAYLYITYGRPPVAVGDHPVLYEREMTHSPLHARIKREAPKSAPIPANDDAFLAGAKIYRTQCMVCHGQPGKTSRFAEVMFPQPPQLWEKEGDHTGVSDDPPGETYWKVRNGIRLTGMPSFNQMLDDTRLWQVSLLLANADKPMPAPVQDELAKNPRD